MKRHIFFLCFLMGTCAKVFAQVNDNNNLFPQQNGNRNILNLSGIWEFKIDSNNVGEKEKWNFGLSQTKPIAVPASWNDQYDELRDYMGYAWYEKKTYVSKSWKGQKIFIRFGSANYAAKVWINGNLLGKHEGGHLPFTFEISDFIRWDADNKIVVQVENILKPERVPPGNVTTEGHFKNYPAGNFDFFPYCGLQRPVWLYSVPISHITDINVNTKIQPDYAVVDITVKKEGNAKTGKIAIAGNNQQYEKEILFEGDQTNVQFKIANARLWDINDPFLYDVSVKIGNGKDIIDSYQSSVGIRTVSVNQNQLLLNGKPVFLKGFGKHEDFPVLGKGTSEPVIVKDFSLLKWVGANSFRTSHYPYDEEYLNMADREGILIIDEIPAVGLYFDKNIAQINQRKQMCEQQITELINRDKNHPSVIMWSVANEPGLGSSYLKRETSDTLSFNFFKDLITTAKKMDSTRLVTLVGADQEPYEWFGLADVICINRYYGWYSQTGDIKEGARLLNKELDVLHKKINKPILITEFGADAYAGMHAENPEMFTEEYQRDFIKAYLEVLNTKDFICGAHVWCFADFKTSQGDRRFGGYNWKGVFTRDRKPKMAAFYLRDKWTKNLN